MSDEEERKSENDDFLEFQEINLGQSFPVFFGSAFLEYSESERKKGRQPNIEKFYNWITEIELKTKSSLGINIAAPIIRTCQQYLKAGIRQASIDTKTSKESSEEEIKGVQVGIITALINEFNAVRILLDKHEILPAINKNALGKMYCHGEIHTDNERTLKVILTLAGVGNNKASSRCTQLLNDFPSLKHIIMCGIAGGVPNPSNHEEHVRLGDIVVSNENGIYNYDYRKIKSYILDDEEPKFSGHRPDATLLSVVDHLKAEADYNKKIGRPSPWMKYIEKACEDDRVKRPANDVLNEFKPELEWKEYIIKLFEEFELNPNITEQEITLKFKGMMKPVSHPDQSGIGRTQNEPLVFYGPIASANIVLKDEILRNKLLTKYGVKAVEMESSGILDATWGGGVGYLTIRGIADYCNLDKNDEWHEYAAVVAAAYTRSLLDLIASR